MRALGVGVSRTTCRLKYRLVFEEYSHGRDLGAEACRGHLHPLASMGSRNNAKRRSRRRQSMGVRLLAMPILCWTAVAGDASVTAHSSLRRSIEEVEICPRCDMIFSMVQTTPSGERVQYVDMQERGEPKSGTALMYHGAQGALTHTCVFLKRWFGSDSCHLEGEDYTGRHHTAPNIGLTFDPRLGAKDAKCHCHGVDRVEIHVSSENKHKLPVQSTCTWYHNNGIAKDKEGCLTVGGRPVQNFNDIWLCMVEADCDVSDERLQFAILRDPRVEAVSTFLFEQAHADVMQDTGSVGLGLDTVDEFVLATLPVLCQWISLRYILFAGILSEQSTIFWYDDAMEDVSKWHRDWLASVGLSLPTAIVEAMGDVDLHGEFDFDTRGKDEHSGDDAEKATGETEGTPTWRDGLRPETVVEMDRIVQQWLPPVILAKMGAVPKPSAQ